MAPALEVVRVKNRESYFLLVPIYYGQRQVTETMYINI